MNPARSSALAGLALVAGLALHATACTGTSKSPADDGPTAERPATAPRGKAKAGPPPRGKAGPPPRGKAPAEGAASGGGEAPTLMGIEGAPKLAFNNASTLLVDDDGTFHAVWLDGRNVVYQRKVGGKAGEETVLGTSDIFGATLVQAGGSLLAAWPAGRKGLEYATSKNGGKSWSKAATVPGVEGAPRNPSMFAWTEGGKGKAVLAWHVMNRGGGGPGGHDDADSEVWSATWTDGKWSKPVRLDGASGHSAFVTVFGTDDGDDIMAMWRDGRDGDRTKHIYAMDYDSGSGKWTGERDVGLEGLDPGACIDGSGRVHVAFHDKLTIFYAHSTDGGKDFTNPVELDPGKKGYFAHLSCSDQTVAVAWERMMEPGGFMDTEKKAVGLALSRNGGKSFDIVDVQGAQRGLSQPGVDLGPGGEVSLIWLDRRSNTVVVANADE